MDENKIWQRLVAVHIGTSDGGVWQRVPVRNLRAMRQFYASFPIRHTLCAELSWSHYRPLMKVEENDRRMFCLEVLARRYCAASRKLELLIR
ncbi:MAG: DUF1016 N-terminal domain-containing protein [Zoogloeaceae bacterium]|jgi:hypothetical protein|nr:DUF1016 N-terminal domain-containing protein [Zoogloeaceae bacterium]